MASTGSTVRLTADLPRASDAECSVLGAVMVDNARLAEIADRLKPEHFGQGWCGLVYTAMLSLAKQSQPIDFLTVRHALGAAMDDVGISRLSKLTDGIPRSANVTRYADIVIDASRRRAAIERASEVIDAAMETSAEADDVIAKAQDVFFRLASSKRTDTLFDANAMTQDLFAYLQSLADRRHQPTGIATGIEDFDRLSFGLQPGELVVLGARPSVGKTALALQIGLHAARHTTVLLCSLEMGSRSVWSRALWNTAKVDGFSYLRGYCKRDEQVDRRIGSALGDLATLPFWVDEQPGMSATDVRAKAQQVQLRHGLGLVIVDYLQLMRPSDGKAAKSQNRTQVVGEMAWELKELARSMQVPVLVLSQLRRSAEEKDRPSMADLRESGDIEAHADIILLLHRLETRAELADLPPGQPSKVELIIEKQRGNPTGLVDLANFRDQYRFASMERV
jgi:replicative DNA helicase